MFAVQPWTAAFTPATPPRHHLVQQSTAKLSLTATSTARPAPLLCAVDHDVIRLPDGTYYNHRLQAQNVWEVDVDESIIEEAAEIFYGRHGDGGPFCGIGDDGAPTYDDALTPVGRFFTQRVSAWRSNIAWVAVDDTQSFARFEALFQRLRLAERFSHVIPHAVTPRLYCAQYVVRSCCEGHNFHTDWNAAVGTSALSLITPLRNYRERASFQLSYKATAGEVQPDGSIALGTTNAERLRERPALRRYEYTKGKAIVFGSRFEHSTEPGAGHEGEPHAYLCFMFGTDEQARWPDIEETMDAQARVVWQPNGELQLSALGRRIERALARLAS